MRGRATARTTDARDFGCVERCQFGRQHFVRQQNRFVRETMHNFLFATGQSRQNLTFQIKKIGNAHIFRATVTRKSAVGSLIDELLGAFGGSPGTLVAHLIDSGKISLSDIKELEKRAQEPKKK